MLLGQQAFSFASPRTVCVSTAFLCRLHQTQPRQDSEVSEPSGFAGSKVNKRARQFEATEQVGIGVST